MLFHSVGFLFVFLPAFLVSILILPKGMIRSVVLLMFSYLFYSGAEPFFVLILVALLFMLILLELTVGQHFERQQARNIFSANGNAAKTYYALPDPYKSVPSSSKPRKRLLYISNSHAKTGGQVPVHLQRLLDRLTPGEFEVLDIILRLARHGFFRKQLGPERIVKEYLDMEPDLSEEYMTSLGGNYPPLTRASIRRYDISEPANARNLMRRLVSLPAGSHWEQTLLYDLSLRLRYWLEGQFAADDNDADDRFSKAFNYAVRHEISKAQERMRIFWEELVEYQTRRLAVVPVPELEETTLVQRYINRINQNVSLVFSHYRMSDESTVIKVTSVEGRPVAYGFSNSAKKLEYQRIDILGDGSFLMLQPLGDRLLLPSWLVHSSPLVRLGV